MKLDKPGLTERIKALQPGDPWTFILPYPILIDDVAVVPGDIIAKWYSTDEPGREFKVLSVRQLNEDYFVYETRFTGFQQFEVKPNA